MEKTEERKRRRLTLKDLELEVKTEEKVKGGAQLVPAITAVRLPTATILGSITLPDWAMGPRSDSGAGDASAWNEGDITLAEAE